jgi:hypothetical protein
MKKLVILLILVLAAIYGIGRFNLGEGGAIRFLTKMESLLNEGKPEEVCAMFHDELAVEIADHSGDATREVTGGKKELCDLTIASAAGLQALPHSMNVEYTEVSATQQLSKPWTGDVSYSEHRTLSILGANVTLRTVSNDEITLVQTLSGVKLLKVKSEVFRADAT